MDFDFYKQYKLLSNIELLLIVKQETRYQQEAVAAAKKLLDERFVSEEEKQIVDAQLKQEVDALERKIKDREQKKEAVLNILEPILKPGTEIKPRKWLALLLIMVSIYFLWRLYTNVRAYHFIFFECGKCELDILTLLTSFELIYIPVMGYLLWKRNRRGWMLLFGANLFIIIDRVMQFFFIVIHFDNLSEMIVGVIASILIRASLGYFLWKEDIAAFFSVNEKDKRNTVLWASMLGGIYLFIMMLIF